MHPLFDNMTFDEIVQFTIDKYSMENGRDKLHTIYEKVMTNNKLSGLISTSRYRKLAPSSNDVLACLASTSYFMLRSNWTHVCAAILFFKRWNEEVNQSLLLLNDTELKLRAISCYTTYKL